MRINQFVAQATGMSRRSADAAIRSGEVIINDSLATLGQNVTGHDEIRYKGQVVRISQQRQTIMLHKPAGYVCSRDGQGSKTIYDLLPKTLHHLKPVGRLDKDSSGLLLLTDDGTLANELTHPRYNKEKVYEVKLDKPLSAADHTHALKGVMLKDGLSRFSRLRVLNAAAYEVIIKEGRNRQIRRTFAALGYEVTELHRIQIGPYQLAATLKSGAFQKL